MTATTTPETLPVETAPLEAVHFDLYKDIHKGIRTELFAVTEAFGRVDPANDDAVESVTNRLHAMVKFLMQHAEHEDEFVQPHIDEHIPAIAAVVGVEHEALEQQMASLQLLADRAAGSVNEARRLALHRVYLGVASFTSEYLQHQAFEELEIMPALARAVSVEKLFEINGAIVASIPPEELTVGLSLMVPAMNVDDRTELVGGIQAGAPPEMFNGVFAFIGTVLSTEDYAQLKARLGIE